MVGAGSRVVLAVGRWLVVGGGGGPPRRAVLLCSDNRSRTRSGGFCDLGHKFVKDCLIVYGRLVKEEDAMLQNRAIETSRRSGLAHFNKR